MRAFFIDPQRPIESRLLDPISNEVLGEMVLSLSNKLQKPRREIRINSWDTLLQDQIEQIRNEIHGGRGTGVFFLDGDIWATINYPIFVGNGNGVQTEFPLPINDAFPSSWKFWDNQTLKTDWTMVRDPATVVFTAAPTGRITGTGKRKFRVILQTSDDSIFTETQLYRNTTDGVYSMNPLVFLEVEAINRV